MGSKTRTLAPFFVLAGLALLGCTEATPNYCQKTSDCPQGRICDVARSVCALPDAGSGPLDGSPGDGRTDTLTGPGLDAGASDVPQPGDAPQPIDGDTLDQAADGETVDLAAPDLYVPDAAGSCGVNSDCPDPSKSLCVNHLCVGCQAAASTACGAQVCEATSGRCVECTADSQCTKDEAKGFCVANACTGCTISGATGCLKRTDGKTVCATTGAAVDRCVECVADSNCTDPSKGFCIANACTGCQGAGATACASRSPGKPVCATSGARNGQCVECAADGECKEASKSFCVANACAGCQAAPEAACASRATSKPLCAASGTLGGQCVECVADGDCKDASKSFCVANACSGCQAAAKTACSARSPDKPVCATRGSVEGQCVACQADTDCTGATPICNASNTCTRCTTDSQCVAKLGQDPGVCMAHQDGRCASAAESLFVASTTGCASSGGTAGTAAQPLCTLQAAVNLLGTDAGKQLIVLRSAADGIAVTRTAQVSLVGQNAASIATGAGSPGLELSGTGNLYVRDLSVVGSTVSNVGISAGAGTTLALERVKVLGNGGGGILLAGAAFRLNDVLVRGNGTGVDGSTTWSGIYIKALPNAGAATQLGLVSIVDNGSPGLNCGFALPPSAAAAASVHAANNGGATGIDILPICGLTPCAPAAAGVCGSSLVP